MKHVRSVAFTLVVWELGWMVYILGIDCGHPDSARLYPRDFEPCGPCCRTL